MRILRLYLHEFGRHRDLEVEFARGMTVVRGPNESGKSTVQRALELALFRKATATGAELETLRSWGAGEDDRSTLRLEFVDEDEDVVSGEITSRTGVVEKEFRGARGRVLLDFDGETTTDPAKADAVLAELTGIPNEQFFRSTASIRHLELADLDRDEGALRDRLQASIGAGDRGSSRAKKRLEDATRALKARGEKNPGRLKIAEETVAQAEGSLRNGEAALARLERDRDALAQARAARQKAEQALSESRGMLEAARQAERLRADREVVQGRYEKYRAAADAQERLRRLEAMPERSIAELRDHLDRMRSLQSRVAILQETIRETTEQEVEADEPVPGFAVPAAVAVTFGAIAVVLAILGGGGMMLLPALGAAMIALFTGFNAYSTWSAARTVKRRNDARERERAIRRQTKVGAEEGLRVNQSGVHAILRELRVSDTGEAEQLLTAEQGRRQEIETLRVQVGALLVGIPADKVGELRDQAALEVEQKTAALEALGPIATDARARERLEAEVRERQAALERARDGEASAAARVEANPIDAEQVAGEAERLEMWREQLAALRRRVRVYESTLEAIQLAERQTMRRATRFLEEGMGRDVERLTGGRYQRIQVDDRTLDIQVFSDERSDWATPGQLSQGTVDQIFLAARIGLVRLVTEGRRPPLVLDDPFVTFDDARAARAALMLRELSSDFQVIYLTCSNRYDTLADAVVELRAPAEPERDVAAPAAEASAAPLPRGVHRNGRKAAAADRNGHEAESSSPATSAAVEPVAAGAEPAEGGDAAGSEPQPA